MSAAERFARFFARRRHAFALAIAAITAFFAWQATRLEIFTQFLDLLPRGHEFVRIYETYRDVYGSANAVVGAVVAREGDVYQPDVLRAVAALTDALDQSLVPAELNARPPGDFVAPHGPLERAVHALVRAIDGLASGPAEAAPTGVDHNLVTSLTHRSARDPRVELDGTLRSPQLVVEIPRSPDELDALRERVRRNPAAFGTLVSTDEKAALVRASFVETRIDYGALWKHLRAAEREIEARYPVEVHLTGQPLLFGWTFAFATEILLVFALTLVVSVALLWGYFRRAYGVFLPLAGAAVNVVWGLGFAGWAGMNLDPLMLVVPMLITARAISHSVQFVERFYEEYDALGDKDEACIRSMAELLLPGTLAILTDVFGLATIALATIPVLEKLGVLCAFWAASIFATEMLLNRLMILYLPPPRERRHHVSPLAALAVGVAARLVESRAGALASVLAFAALGALCFGAARRVTVGDDRPGSPLLYPDSEFNVAARELGARFFGLDDLLVVAHSEELGRTYAPDAFKLVESVQRVLETDPAAGGSVSLVDLLKQTNGLFHHTDRRFEMWMQSTAEISGISYLLETSVPAPGILNPFRATDGHSLAIRVFYRDHTSATVTRAIERLRSFADRERLDGVELRYAAGTIGLRAASNEEIAASADVGLAVVFAATFLVLLLSYRGLVIPIVLTLSLASASLAALALQAWLGIGTDVNTLPVQAIGVGIGVDYAIYLVDRMLEERRRFPTRLAAISHAIRTTGLAIGFTASTLVLGIGFWIPVSSLRFSAEMSLLLCVLMGVNALSALLFVPALCRLLPDRLAGRLR